MNRADRMLSVLHDGRIYSRREIFDRVGFMLTNDAAAELRLRGLDVQHSQDGRVHCYQLGEVEEGGNGERQSGTSDLHGRVATPPSSTSSQLSLEISS